MRNQWKTLARNLMEREPQQLKARRTNLRIIKATYSKVCQKTTEDT